MGNQYLILIETLRVNLERIMRHINSVDTQRYNRLKNKEMKCYVLGRGELTLVMNPKGLLNRVFSKSDYGQKAIKAG